MSAAASAIPVTRPEGQTRRPRLVVGARRRAMLAAQGVRLVHRRTDNLSAAGRKLMIEGFRSRKPYRTIARELTQIGEPVSERAVGRTGFVWRQEENRRRALAELNGQVLRSWQAQELIGLVEQLDLKPGWPLRARKALWLSLRRFFKRPTGEGLRGLEEKLLLYWLTHQVSRAGGNHEQ